MSASEIVARIRAARFSFSPRHFSLGPIDFDFKLGEITGVVGVNGSGKTTLLRLISGEFSLHDGTLEYPSLCENRLDWECIKRHVRFMQTHNNYFGHFGETVYEAIASSASKFGLTGKENKNLTNELIERFHLEKYRESSYSELSDGFRHRVAIARVLAARPKMILLDEPLANLDITSRRMILEQLKSEMHRRDHDVSIVVTAQDIRYIESISDNVIVFNEGRPSYAGSLEDIPRHTGLNAFELVVANGQENLESALDEAPDFIRSTVTGMVLYFRKEKKIDSSRLVRNLASSGISIRYFSDISNSAQILVEGDLAHVPVHGGGR